MTVCRSYKLHWLQVCGSLQRYTIGEASGLHTQETSEWSVQNEVGLTTGKIAYPKLGSRSFS